MNQDPPDPIDPRLVPALSHPLRVRILEALAERAAATPALAHQLDTPLSDVAYAVQALHEYGAVVRVEGERKGPSPGPLYKAVPPGPRGGWRRMPHSVREGVSAASFQDFAARRGVTPTRSSPEASRRCRGRRG